MIKAVLLCALLALTACAPQGGGIMEELTITSPAFRHNGMIPAKFTCLGEDINPAIEIEGIPEGTQSLTLIIDDPDAPVGTWDHWVVFNIPVTAKIYEDSKPGVQGVNSWRKHSYGGPCPPSGTHRYFFKVYALDTKLDLPEAATKADVEHAMQEHILAQGTLIGRFQKQ